MTKMPFKKEMKNTYKGRILQEKIDELKKYYEPLDLDPSHCGKKKMSVTKLEDILKRTTRKKLQDSDFKELLICSLTALYFFGMRLKIVSLKTRWICITKRRFQKAESIFQKTMDFLQPERSEMVIKITLNFFSTVSIWSYESFVVQILEVVLYFGRGKMTLFNIMLTDIHRVLFFDVKSARHRMRVLYDLLNSGNWVIDKQKLLPFITRLLDFFASSISKNESKKSGYKYLQKGFEVCLRRIFERAENQHRLLIITTMLNWFSLVNMSDDDVLEFSLLLDRAAELYHIHSYTDSFNQGTFEHVLKHLVGSSNANISLVGARLLQRFLDRNHNVPNLIMPMLYYKFLKIRLVVGTYDSGDKIFIRQHREKIHDYFLRAIKKHCHSNVNLNASFAVIGCVVLEVPCGLTAAAAACLAMSIQDFALNGENLRQTTRYWLHAVVISVMSLICWVHKAPVLYSYVNKIISRRAKEAPHLNPPLRPAYNFDTCHVTWNKPTLFFEDWELRYGLWKHFQDTQSTETHKLSSKAPTIDVLVHC